MKNLIFTLFSNAVKSVKGVKSRFRRDSSKGNPKINIQALQNVRMEDLLERPPINTSLNRISEYLDDKVVLVTGAGGSIGSEICRQASLCKPKMILLLGHGENSIFTIEKELKNNFSNLSIKPIIADIQDLKRLQDVFAFYKPDVIFHAAAHKHVPLMEVNPSEAIENNVFGTKNVAECAISFGAERMVFISSDKAVNSSSIMGATKRLAEYMLLSLGKNSDTKFTIVRFGNVLGSRGSVVPLFIQQILDGGPITITHPDMVRFFMTIPEAVQLVLQAGALAQGKEIFILDMGKPVKILDLAHKLILLADLKPNEDIEIIYTGMRPGEKLVEEIFSEEEKISVTKHNLIYICESPSISEVHVNEMLEKVEYLLAHESTVEASEKLHHIIRKELL